MTMTTASMAPGYHHVGALTRRRRLTAFLGWTLRASRQALCRPRTTLLLQWSDCYAIQLGKEKDEIKHKDFCTAGYNKNQLESEKKERERQYLEARIEDLELTIKTLTDQIDALKDIPPIELVARNGKSARKLARWRCRHAPRLLQCSAGTSSVSHPGIDGTSVATM